MSKLKVAATILLFALLFLTPFEGVSQQRRQPPKPVRKATTTPASVPTFDTLLGAGTYNVYVEVRGVGQLVRSNSINEVLEPIMTLSDPPKEFKTLVRWLNTRADDVMTSRMFVAAWPLEKNLPDGLVAIEFSSVEEAAKFEPQLNSFLPKILPPTPQEDAGPSNEPKSEEKAEKAPPPKPNYYLQQVGSLILITPTPLKVKDLRPTKAKLFTEEPSFRVAKNRFAAEQIFVYVDFEGIEKESQNRRKEYEEAEEKRAEEQAKDAAKKPVTVEAAEEKQAEEEQPPVEVPTVESTNEIVEAAPVKPDEMTVAVETLGSAFFQGQGKMPDAMGFGIALEADSFEVRALMVSKPGEKCDPIPFFPNLIPGPPIVPESPSILPADTELFASLSLDFPQIYAAMSKPNRTELAGPYGRAEIKPVGETEVAGPFAEIEKRLHIKVKEDLMPLLGSEVVVSLPLNFLEGGPIPKSVLTAPSSESKQTDEKVNTGPSFLIALSLKDKEGMKALLPKIIDSIGFKGASAIGQTERHDNVELVSYANAFSYAFIENFLIFSPDPKATRHVVDSYLKHETVASDPQFKNYTRWQPRQLQGQLYVSPVLMEGFKTWANQTSTVSEQMKEILGRLGLVAQPVTYSLSNDGIGTTHEIHVPKNLVLMLITSMASESNPSPMIQNERSAMTALWMIANAEDQYRSGKGNGSFGTLEQLIAAELVSEEQLKNHGYKVELTIFGDRFEVIAVPDEYGKTGRTSYFVDQTHVLRAGDHGGGAATANDKPLGQ